MKKPLFSVPTSIYKSQTEAVAHLLQKQFPAYRFGVSSKHTYEKRFEPVYRFLNAEFEGEKIGIPPKDGAAEAEGE